jgi:hypothetical protein
MAKTIIRENRVEESGLMFWNHLYEGEPAVMQSDL